jgi:hypothetical protein
MTWRRVIGYETAMVDKLMDSLEGLEPPTCPTCNVQMKWTRSELIEADPVVIAHVFHCSTCERIEKTQSFSKPAIPTGKLSAPLHWMKAA